MLICPAIVGTICFLYGIISINSNDNIPSKEICNVTGPGNITLCPLCDKACEFQKLHESCLFSKITYLFDNPATVFFAIFMSLWGEFKCSISISSLILSVSINHYASLCLLFLYLYIY